ncbi:MAG: hypothetical protein IPI67_05155 [Myxococcales bacterium]|nr:hypothetical protein [Myxococcales bacterium]
MGQSINVYDYVNHPYAAVRDKLTIDALEVFRSATRVAAVRAKTVASGLHVNFRGIELGTEIAISVNSIEEEAKQAMSSPVTRIHLEWEAANMPRLFPFMKAELSVYPLTSTETQLSLAGNYEPPLGLLGGLIDSVVGHRIAEAAVHQFISDIAVYLRNELSPEK